MISEITFSKKYTSFWNEILPNAKNYVRLINGGLLHAEYEPFPPTPRKQNISLINELSFSMLRSFIRKKESTHTLLNPNYMKSDNFKTLMKLSLESLSKFSYGNDYLLPLKNDELKQIQQLFKMTIEHFNTDPNIFIDPEFDGCGFVNQSFGDLIYNKTLIEIKSGERKFSLTDIRQLIIYLTLNHYSFLPFELTEIQLFNPRMGISFTENIDDFCLNTSALNSTELYSEIQKYITENNFIEDPLF
ncbi:hypothetical protein ABQJ53_05025 [Morganella morganii]|uniref:hypothetical protein n=1 Tax=Morganella morganii TaxID=582 RepID=UPI003F207799